MRLTRGLCLGEGDVDRIVDGEHDTWVGHLSSGTLNNMSSIVTSVIRRI